MKSYSNIHRKSSIVIIPTLFVICSTKGCRYGNSQQPMPPVTSWQLFDFGVSIISCLRVCSADTTKRTEEDRIHKPSTLMCWVWCCDMGPSPGKGHRSPGENTEPCHPLGIWYGYRSIFRMVISPNGHQSEWSMVRMVNSPKGHQFEWSVVRRVMVRMVSVPNGQ